MRRPLAFDPFYEPLGFGISSDEGDLHRAVYAGHLECSGRLTGSLRVGERKVEVDALCHRDRSWGARRIDSVVTNRMFTGTMGPGLSFAAIEIQTDEAANRHGFVVRDGVVTPCEDLVILPAIGLDGYSVDSGVAHLKLAGGEVLTITAETIDGQLTPWDGYLSSEHLSIARCGDLVGMCDNELTNNPRLGTADLPFLNHVDGGDGLSTRPARVVEVTDLYDDGHSQGSRWTRVNIGEAIPGVPTPLSWSLWRPAMEHGFWGSQARSGVASRRDVGSRAVTGIALGRPCISVDVTVAQIGRLPGYDPDAFAEQYFGLPGRRLRLGHARELAAARRGLGPRSCSGRGSLARARRVGAARRWGDGSTGTRRPRRRSGRRASTDRRRRIRSPCCGAPRGGSSTRWRCTPWPAWCARAPTSGWGRWRGTPPRACCLLTAPSSRRSWPGICGPWPTDAPPWRSSCADTASMGRTKESCRLVRGGRTRRRWRRRCPPGRTHKPTGRPAPPGPGGRPTGARRRPSCSRPCRLCGGPLPGLLARRGRPPGGTRARSGKAAFLRHLDVAGFAARSLGDEAMWCTFEELRSGRRRPGAARPAGTAGPS